MRNSRWLYVWIIALFVCAMCAVPIWAIALGSLVYGMGIFLLHFHQSLFWLGYLLHGMFNRPEKALPLYTRAYQHGARPGPPMIAYAMLLLEAEEYAQALEVLQEVRKQKNLRPQLEKISRMDLALAYEKNGNLAEAIETLEQMRADYAYLRSDFYATLGYLYIEANEYEKAEACNLLALEQEENCAAVYDNRGLMARKTGEDARAEALFRKALELDSSMVSPKFQLGCIAEARGDAQTAAAYFRAVHESALTGLSTVSRAQAEEKYVQFCEKP